MKQIRNIHLFTAHGDSRLSIKSLMAENLRLTNENDRLRRILQAQARHQDTVTAEPAKIKAIKTH